MVNGVLIALDNRYDGRLVIGSGRSVTELELVEAVRTVTGKPIPVQHVETPAEEAANDIANDIANDLGYAPTVSLADGLAATWEYVNG